MMHQCTAVNKRIMQKKFQEMLLKMPAMCLEYIWRFFCHVQEYRHNIHQNHNYLQSHCNCHHNKPNNPNYNSNNHPNYNLKNRNNNPNYNLNNRNNNPNYNPRERVGFTIESRQVDEQRNTATGLLLINMMTMIIIITIIIIITTIIIILMTTANFSKLDF